MHPTAHKFPFSDPKWLFEPKWDGYRSIALIESGKVRLISRQNRELTDRFRDLSTIGHAVKAESALLDGEIVALDQEGKPCFSDLQSRKKCFVVYFAFDLLSFNGIDLRDEPLIKRKKALKKIIKKAPHLRLTEYVIGKGEQLFSVVASLGLEGIVCKRLDSAYRPGRSKLWLKIKTPAGKEEMKKRIQTWGHK